MRGPAPSGFVPPGGSSVPSDAVSDEKADVSTSSAPDVRRRRLRRERIPEATVLRLPVYQRILAELVRAGARPSPPSSWPRWPRLNAAKVRKDLSLLGSFGTRGSGCDPGFLISQIDRALGVDEYWAVAIVGIGNLGRALTNSQGFASRGSRSPRCSTSTRPSSGKRSTA